ncbi:MAG: cyclase family protein [Endomicrobium sp.]|jgi:kynurenine formamidase|nr:cyclase family protein [Endomicrobium sp.]
MKILKSLAAAAAIAAIVLTQSYAQTNKNLWQELDSLKSDYNWVDLSFEVSPETPHWHGFDPLLVTAKYTFENTDDWFESSLYTLPGQYGTHTDFPGHFAKGHKLASDYTDVKELAYKLIIIDKSKEASKNPDYELSKQDILDFEKRYGLIPEGSFVAFRSDWSKRSAAEYENKDKKGVSHYPGWSLEALQYLIKDRNVAVIGHETPDTDSAVAGEKLGFVKERYVLQNDRLNVELLRNLDKVPPTGSIVFVTFPNIKNGTGFTSRVFAITPKK